MVKPLVIVTRRWPDAVETALAERYDVRCNVDDVPMTAEALKEAFRVADAVCPTVSDRITAEVLDASPKKARIICNFGVGFNHIDLEAARRQGLAVTNTPDVLTDCTADLTMTLLLMVARRTGEGERHLRDGMWTGWRPTHMMGTRVTGKTLGLIGFGRIGRAVAHRAHFGFGMKVCFFDPSAPRDPTTTLPGAVMESSGARALPPGVIAKSSGARALPPGALPASPSAFDAPLHTSSPTPAAPPFVRCDSVEEVLEQSDFVSLHCPGGGKNTHLIDRKRLEHMLPHAFLINTARGDVVDEQALLEALTLGTIAGAGLDVYPAEPVVNPDLLAMENVVLLPHLGSATHETRTAMGMRVLENLDDFFAGREPRDRVV